MKKLNYLSLLLIGFILLSCGGTQQLESEDFETKSFDLSAFHAISVAEGIDVVLYKSFDHRAEATSNFMEYLRVEVIDSTLTIDFDEPAFSKLKKDKTSVEVWAKDINQFRASSSANLEVDGNFKSPKQTIYVASSGNVFYDVKSDNVTIEVSSSGDYEGVVETHELFAAAASSGDIKIKGSAKIAHLQASSAGDIDGADFIAEVVDASVSSSGDVKIGVSKELNANVSSSGDLKYKPHGNIKMNIDKSSGGDVKEIKGIF